MRWPPVSPYSRPKTGYPLDNELLSVTIISDASIDGDIYTTLIYGLGWKRG